MEILETNFLGLLSQLGIEALASFTEVFSFLSQTFEIPVYGTFSLYEILFGVGLVSFLSFAALKFFIRL